MKLHEKIIEITNKADLKGILPKDLKAKYIKFLTDNQYYEKPVYNLGGTYMFRLVQSDTLNIYEVEKSLRNMPMPIIVLHYLVSKITPPAVRYTISSSGRITKEALERLKITDFPEKLLEGTPEFHAITCMIKLSQDPRSKFYNIKTKSLFEQM